MCCTVYNSVLHLACSRLWVCGGEREEVEEDLGKNVGEEIFNTVNGILKCDHFVLLFLLLLHEGNVRRDRGCVAWWLIARQT